MRVPRCKKHRLAWVGHLEGLVVHGEISDQRVVKRLDTAAVVLEVVRGQRTELLAAGAEPGPAGTEP